MYKYLRIFLKFMSASGIATTVDFSASYSLVSGFQVNDEWATLVGNILGAIIGFWVSRTWVFQAKDTQSLTWQGIKYAIVAVGNSAMNVGGVALLSQLGSWHYLTVRVVVGVIVFVVYSYGLNQWFVFKNKTYEKVSL